MEKKRSFAKELNETGSAAQIRSQVSVAFASVDGPSGRNTLNAMSSLSAVGAGTFLNQTLSLSQPANNQVLSRTVSGTSSMNMEVVDPIDYEKFIRENSSLLENSAIKDLLLFPNDDVSITTMQRRFRTVQIPVPGQAKRCDDPLVRDCVRSFTQDWVIVNRKFGSFHGEEENLLRRFSTCKRTPSYSKLLPQHQYEVDLPPKEGITDAEKRLYRASMTSMVDYNLEATECDKLLLEYLDQVDDGEVDEANRTARTNNRHPSLFGLYPLPDRRDARENRTPAPPPSESQGLRLHIKLSELKLEVTIEPIFAAVALYDAKERRKISETFYIDINQNSISKMLDHLTPKDASIATASRSGIFNITYPHSDVFLVIRIEKVLQQGDLGDIVETYQKLKDMDPKALDRQKSIANHFCQQLGRYRMPFAWTAINVLDLLASNQSQQGPSMASSSSVSDIRRGGSEKDRDSSDKGRGGTPEPNRRRDTRTNSMSSQQSRAGLEESLSSADVKDNKKQAAVAALTQNFCAVTLSMNAFYKQETERLGDEQLFRYLPEHKKAGASFSKRFKTIQGSLKVDICAPYENMPRVLTSNLWEVDPFPDNKTRRPIREIEEFPPLEVYSPFTTYKHMLYVSPISLDFRSRKERNLGIKIQFMSGEDPEDVCCNIYGKSNTHQHLREIWTPVCYHNKQPEFYDEIKIELPPRIHDKHHILFCLYKISCQKPKQGEAVEQDPIFLGCTWIPMLQDGKIQVGEFNLSMTADQPPPAYSQLSSDVALPNLKWIDGHKPIFKVHLNLVSSIHPQDNHLLKFMKSFYEYNPRLGNESEEKALASCVLELKKAKSDRIVEFLHVTVNNLATLLVRPSVTEESVSVCSNAFEALAHVVHTVQSLDLLARDKHDRNVTLASYIQYVFNSPQGQHSAGAFNARTATLTKSRAATNEDYEYSSVANKFKGGSVRGTKGVSFSEPSPSFEDTHATPHNAVSKVFHEQIALQWLLGMGNGHTRNMVLKNSWFFFEMMIKGMAQYLHRSSKVQSSRKDRFSVKFMEDLEKLVRAVATEICQNHIRDCNYARTVNSSVAFFIHDALSLMDRGFVFSLIRTYLKKFNLSMKDLNLTEFRLDFYRIVCSHEHYVILNLPLGSLLYPVGAGSQHSSPSGSISSTFEGLDMTNVEAMGELSAEFRHNHFLSGLLLSELAQVLEGRDSKLKEQAIQVLRDLLASHDSDSRFNTGECRATIASIYLPLLSIVMDNYPNLYKGADGWEDWTTTFERNSAIRRSVVIRESSEGGASNEDRPGNVDASGVPQLLGPVSTRNLLVCVLWVLKSIDRDLLSMWWNSLSITRLSQLIAVTDLCVSCFEYKGKRNVSTSQAPSSSSRTSTGSDIKHMMANAIKGEGTARERLRARKVLSQQPQAADVLRWGKTYWQSATEHADRPKADMESDATIEGSLAAEASLIVLDTLELLVQSLTMEAQSMLGKVLEVLLHLMGSNQSTEVMGCVFATQRAIVSKYPELVFYEETEQCAELCARLLRHCSSSVEEIRAWACASLYLLMRQNFELLGNSFARVKVQVTVALSSIVAGTSTFNEHHLRRSLKTLLSYARQDEDMKENTFPDQVQELSLNLHRILLDTVKMQEFQDDPEMLMDLMYRISKGYQNSPDLRLTWLQHMAEKHSAAMNYTEAAMCLVHGAALVAEYLFLLEGLPYLPVGCIAFQKLSPNVLEESAVSDDVVNPEDEGICTSKLFTEDGMVQLLEEAADLFKEAQMYEAMSEVYKLVLPIHEARRNHVELEKVYSKLSHCYNQLVQKGEHRFLGSYFRVGFYGLIFGDMDRQEFVYKEPGITRLGEFTLKLQKLYEEKVGNPDLIEVVKDSNEVDTDAFLPHKGYIQVTFVEPYFDEWELKHRATVFDRSFNIRRFAFNTPYTPGGKAQGDVNEQYMLKTILTATESFPYVKKRSLVIKSERFELIPLEVVIIGMQDKIHNLRKILDQNPTDGKLLQMQLQGVIATSVHKGPFHIAQNFLDIPKEKHQHLHRRLIVCFKELTRRCEEALEVNKMLITEEQADLQKELVKSFKDFRDKLEPMVSTKKKHKRSRDRALLNIASSRSSRLYSSGEA